MMWEEQLQEFIITNDLALFEDWLITYEAETGDTSLRDLLLENILNMICPSINRVLPIRYRSNSRSRSWLWSISESWTMSESWSRSLARSKARPGSGSRTRTRAWSRPGSLSRH